jgi:hypothetical protein
MHLCIEQLVRSFHIYSVFFLLWVHLHFYKVRYRLWRRVYLMQFVLRLKLRVKHFWTLVGLKDCVKL